MLRKCTPMSGEVVSCSTEFCHRSACCNCKTHQRGAQKSSHFFFTLASALLVVRAVDNVPNLRRKVCDIDPLILVPWRLNIASLTWRDDPCKINATAVPQVDKIADSVENILAAELHTHTMVDTVENVAEDIAGLASFLDDTWATFSHPEAVRKFATSHADRNAMGAQYSTFQSEMIKAAYKSSLQLSKCATRAHRQLESEENSSIFTVLWSYIMSILWLGGPAPGPRIAVRLLAGIKCIQRYASDAVSESQKLKDSVAMRSSQLNDLVDLLMAEDAVRDSQCQDYDTWKLEVYDLWVAKQPPHPHSPSRAPTHPEGTPDICFRGTAKLIEHTKATIASADILVLMIDWIELMMNSSLNALEGCKKSLAMYSRSYTEGTDLDDWKGQLARLDERVATIDTKIEERSGHASKEQ